MLTQAGVDTWSPCWRLDGDSDPARSLCELATQPTRRGRLLTEPVEGHRVVWFEGARLLAAEGHPGGEGVLASPEQLPAALAGLQRALEERLGAALPGPKRFEHSSHGFEGVRRLDVTADLRSESGAQGLAVLSGIAATRPRGRVAARVRRQAGGRAVETVDWLTQRGIVARAYDKGLESNTAARGVITRLEAQNRWPSGYRRDVEELTAAYVCRAFRKRFVPLWQASKGVTVVTMEKLAERLASLVQDGELTIGQAEQLCGYLVLESAGVRSGSRQTSWRRRKLAEEVGLTIADGVLEPVEVNLSEVLEQAIDEGAWERRG